MSTESQEEQSPSVPSEPFQDLPWPFGSLAWRYRCPGNTSSKAVFKVQRAACSPAIKQAKFKIVPLRSFGCNKVMPLATLAAVFKCDRQTKKASNSNVIHPLHRRRGCHFVNATKQLPSSKAKCNITPKFKSSAVIKPLMNSPQFNCRTYDLWRNAAGTKVCHVPTAAESSDFIKPKKPLYAILCYVTEKAKWAGREGRSSRCGNILSVDNSSLGRALWLPSMLCLTPPKQALATVTPLCRKVIKVDNVPAIAGLNKPTFTCRLFPTTLTVGSKSCNNINLADAPLLAFGRVFGGVAYKFSPITSGRVIGNWFKK